MSVLGGLVLAYDPDRGLYRLLPDMRTQVWARAVRVGAGGPFPVGVRVLCLHVAGTGWIIVGEIPTAQPDPNAARPATVEESVADLLSRAGAAAAPSGDLDAAPMFRAADPEFVGDAALTNRPPDRRAASGVRVFSFGAVLLKASDICYALLDRRESQLLLHARSLLFRAMGYLRTVVTRADDPRTLVREELRPDPLNVERTNREAAPLVDRETLEGFVPAPDGRAGGFPELFDKPRLSRGRRETVGGFSVAEDDVGKGVLRRRVDVVEHRGEDGERRTFEAAAAVGAIDGEGEGAAKRGFRAWLRAWLRLEADNEAETVTLDHLTAGEPTRVVLTRDAVLLERGGQRVRIDAEGVFVKAKNFVVDAEQRVVLRAGSEIAAAAPVINHTG